jgi:hypothetical protein
MPASSIRRTRSATAGSDSPTRRPNSAKERRASSCNARKICQPTSSSSFLFSKVIVISALEFNSKLAKDFIFVIYFAQEVD